MNKTSKIITISSLSLTFVVICILVVVLIQPKSKYDDASSLSTSTISTSSFSSEINNVVDVQASTSSKKQSSSSSMVSVSHNTSSTKSQLITSKEPVSTSSESPTPESSSSEATTLPVVSDPSSSNNDEAEKREFIQMYTETKNSYMQQLSTAIAFYNQEIASLNAKSSEYYSNKLAEDRRINLKFEAMGMLNSGAHKSALKTNEENYLSAVRDCQDKISDLAEKIETLEKGLENINPYTILGMFPEEHGITVSEAVEKYLKYMSE